MEIAIKKAIELLDKKYNLPKKGFIAGGALGNTINKLKWGGKCVINDIDIFLVDKITPLNKKEIFDKKIPKSFITKFKNKSDICILDNYNDRLHISKLDNGEDYIIVTTSERNDIFNLVKFDTNQINYSLFLQSFDINCTQVGYDLENGVAYWTKEFEEYINTKELKITLPNTPSHTALRILKKRDELDAKLNIDEEFNFLNFIINQHDNIKGVKKQWFAKKYYQLYEQYKKEIEKYFIIEESLIHKGYNPNFLQTENIKIWRLNPKKIKENIIDSNNFHITIDECIYFWRNVKDNPKKRLLWKNLYTHYINDDYLKNYDLDNLEKDINKLNILKTYPILNVWLKHLTLKEQLKYISDLELVCNDYHKFYDIFVKM
jgi:hypothetical protein